MKGQQQKMVIGRPDERDIPIYSPAHCDAANVFGLAQTIWAAVMRPHRKAGHMIALVPIIN